MPLANSSDSKVVWYIDQYVGHPKYGNVYRNFYIAQELQAKGHEVKLFSASYSHLMYNFPVCVGTTTKETLDNIEFNWIKVNNYGGGRSIGRVKSIFEFSFKLFVLRRSPPPDIIVTPSLSMIPIWPILIMRKFFWKKKPKLVFEVRDIWPLTLTTLGGKSKLNPFVQFLGFTEKVAYRKADYIISTLKMCPEHISSRISSKYRFKWIDNGINVPDKDITLPVDIRNKIPDNKFIVGYTGSLGLANAMTFFVEAAKLFADNSNIHFVIVGGGSEEVNLKKLAEGSSNITFISKLNKLYIPSILSLFDVLYLSYANVPDLYKFGVSANKTYEYMLSGKPIILSSVPMSYNIIEKANCGIVLPPENVSAIYDAVFKMYNTSSEKRIKMGKNGKEYILRNNTFRILGEKVNEIIIGL